MIHSIIKRFLIINIINSVIILTFIGICTILDQIDLLRSYDGLFFDSYHYRDISQKGYSGFLVAFFPLFPFLWSLFPLGPMGVSVFNIVVFAIGYAILAYSIKLTITQQTLLQLIPSFVFFFIPYTESLFFLFSSIIIIGIIRCKFQLILLGLFLSSLVRPAAVVFLPALLIFYWNPQLKMRERIISIGLSYFAIVLALSLVFYIQKTQTGEWFSFFTVQEEGWGNKLAFPKFPLMSWGGNFMTLFDGIVLWVCAICGILSLCGLRKRYKSTQTTHQSALLFSLIIVSGTGLMILLTRGGMLFSLNRFILATPFIVVILQHILTIRFKFKQAILISSSLIPFSLALGSYNHIQHLLKYVALSVILVIFLLSLNRKEVINKIMLISFIMVVFGTQLYFFHRIITGQWVG